MESYNIIGDIAGYYHTMLALLEKMPQGIPLCVGDMIDRGPRSKEVLEFFRQPNRITLMGNHEHMMVDSYKKSRIYDDYIWFYNGGRHTVRSLLALKIEDEDPINWRDLIDPALIHWMASLSPYIELGERSDGLKGFISHAPPFSLELISRASEVNQFEIGKMNYWTLDHSMIWNRMEPIRFDGFYQISGHNSHWGLKRFVDKDGEFGMCIDSSESSILTGVHWPTMEVYQQEYID